VTYAENLVKLENFVMVKFADDMMVEPRESGHFEFYIPGQDKEILPLRESQLYLEDWIGLKHLDESGKLHRFEVPGDHLQVSTQWLIDEIIHKFFM
jgi:palmitoyl-protein thioesterase